MLLMKKIMQPPTDDVRSTGMPQGMPACLASLLEIPLSDVPDLVGNEFHAFWNRTNTWLKLRGFVLAAMQADGHNITGYHIQLYSLDDASNTLRTVICYGPRVVHDPCGSLPSTAIPLRQMWALLPLNPRN